jgi:hypothetical protein
MKTFRLWLEPDTDIPRFQRLHWEQADVSIADVLTKGVHPWMGPKAHPSLSDRMVEVVNLDAHQPPELRETSYCGEVTQPGAYRWKYVHAPSQQNSQNSCFEETLKRIHDSVYFVDALRYTELVEIAKEQLRAKWSDAVAGRLLEHTRMDFNSARAFIKAKDPELKILRNAKLRTGAINAIHGFGPLARRRSSPRTPPGGQLRRTRHRRRPQRSRQGSVSTSRSTTRCFCQRR